MQTNIEASRCAEARTFDCKRDRLWVRFPLGEINHHSTRNAFRIQRKMGNGTCLNGTKCLSINFPGSLRLLYYVWNIAEIIKSEYRYVVLNLDRRFYYLRQNKEKCVL